MHYQYQFSALVSQTSFCGKKNGSIAKSGMFSQAIPSANLLFAIYMEADGAAVSNPLSEVQKHLVFCKKTYKYSDHVIF